MERLLNQNTYDEIAQDFRWASALPRSGGDAAGRGGGGRKSEGEGEERRGEEEGGKVRERERERRGEERRGEERRREERRRGARGRGRGSGERFSFTDVAAATLEILERASKEEACDCPLLESAVSRSVCRRLWQLRLLETGRPRF
eukprot:172813-Hanusia_phi.AAC.1